VTTLGLGLKEVPKGELAASFRLGWLKHFRVVLSSAGGAAMVLGLFELLQRQPIEGFRLLSVWGPWPIVALVALAFIGRFLSRMNDTIQTTFGSVVISVHQGVDAQTKTADALSRLADQGGRQAEQVERLAIYATQEFPFVYERFDRQDEMLVSLDSSVKALCARLDASGRGNGGGDGL
jgi:hypothetical protein